MTYALERSAIEQYLIDGWASATPIGFDRQTFEPVANSISLTINGDNVIQGSIGRSANRIESLGLVQVMIYTEAGKGSSGWRGYADALHALFFQARITSAGAAISAVDQEFIRFSPNQQHPYVAATQVHEGLMMTTFNAPFVRYTTE